MVAVATRNVYVCPLPQKYRQGQPCHTNDTMLENLNSLGFESGLTEEEKECVYLRSRSAGLTVSGCAHAVFLCQLVSLLR